MTHNHSQWAAAFGREQQPEATELASQPFRARPSKPLDLPDGFSPLELPDSAPIHYSQAVASEGFPSQNLPPPAQVWQEPGPARAWHEAPQAYTGSSQLAATLQSLGIPIADGEHVQLEAMLADMQLGGSPQRSS